MNHESEMTYGQPELGQQRVVSVTIRMVDTGGWHIFAQHIDSAGKQRQEEHLAVDAVALTDILDRLLTVGWMFAEREQRNQNAKAQQRLREHEEREQRDRVTYERLRAKFESPRPPEGTLRHVPRGEAPPSDYPDLGEVGTGVTPLTTPPRARRRRKARSRKTQSGKRRRS